MTADVVLHPGRRRTCLHCAVTIGLVDGTWVDMEATGDDAVWRETCQENDTFTAEHEPGPPTAYPLTVGLSMGDYDEPVAQVVVGPATFTLHSSTVTPDTVNVEADGDFSGSEGLRLHVNDCLVYDTRLPFINFFQADELEAALRILTHLFYNASDDALDLLNGEERSLCHRIITAAEAQEDPRYGHCDTCGAPCDKDGCTRDHDHAHVAALDVDDPRQEGAPRG